MTAAMKGILRLSGMVLLAVSSAGAQSAASPIKTTGDVISSFKSGDWPTYNGDYTGRRYSGLTQITPANVGRLQAVRS